MKMSGYNRNKKTPNNTANAIDGVVDAPPTSITDAVYEDQASDSEDECQCQTAQGLKCAYCTQPLYEQDPKIIGDRGIYCSMDCASNAEPSRYGT